MQGGHKKSCHRFLRGIPTRDEHRTCSVSDTESSEYTLAPENIGPLETSGIRMQPLLHRVYAVK